jgi:tetratricopeptide (TPR) repeat protein
LGLAHFWLGRWDEAAGDLKAAAEAEEAGVWEGLDSSCLLRLQAYRDDKQGTMRILKAKPRPTPRMPLRRRVALGRAFVRAARAAGLKMPAIWEVLSPIRDRSLERRVYRRGVPKSTGTAQMTVGAVEALAVLGMDRAAFKLYPVVLEMMSGGDNLMPFHCDRLLQTAAGIAAAAGGQWAKAEEHYKTAMEQARELPHRLEAPEVRRFYAAMLQKRGAAEDRDKARELLSEAAALYRELGMPRHVEMAETLAMRT